MLYVYMMNNEKTIGIMINQCTYVDEKKKNQSTFDSEKTRMINPNIWMFCLHDAVSYLGVGVNFQLSIRMHVQYIG